MIDLDITFFIQLANFLIVLAVLNPLLIKPIRNIIRARKEAATSLLGEAEDFFRSSESKLTQYESALTAAREEGLVSREKVRQEALAVGEGIAAGAAREAQDSLKAARENIEAQTTAALTALHKEITPLAMQIITRVTA